MVIPMIVPLLWGTIIIGAAFALLWVIIAILRQPRM